MEAVNDDNGRCIGVWGPGGVGKTALVKALYNKLAESKPPFDLVKLIELKQKDGNSNVQEAIAKSLELSMGEGTEVQEAIAKRLKDQIHNKLQRKKFLLILDNVWSESIQFSSIGIPKGKKGSKIIVTTRFRGVCTEMDAKEIEMERLTKEEAWRLFVEKAGQDANDEKIKPEAEKVCDECGGLPLALVIVGSAMKRKTDIDEWNIALRKLQGSIPINEDVESKLYDHLNLSYDSLSDQLKSCFLYCSLYPEGWNIEINDLVQCWIAEDLIKGHLYYGQAYGEGLSLVRKLINSCLLEHGHVDESDDDGDEGFRRVKMHDMVRDGARWMAESTGKSIVFSGYGISKTPSVALSGEVQRFDWISFVDNEEIELPITMIVLPKATTLLLHGKSSHVEVSTGFLKGFQKLRVMNMWAVESLSASLLELKELRALVLRNCSGIKEVPETLQILDLSYSMSLEKLPENLTNLRALILSHTNFSSVIGADVIGDLNVLEVLDMSHCRYRWRTRKSCDTDAEATLEDLSALRRLREVYVQLADASGTYAECSWMKKLESFHFSYRRRATRCRREKKIYVAADRGTEVGSFILHAETLSLQRIGCVNLIFANFSSSDQSNSKLKTLSISMSTFVTKSTIIAPKYSVLSNLEKLYLYRNGVCKSFSEIASALGAKFPRLKRLEFDRSVEVVFSSSDPHIQLPLLDRLRMEWCFGTEVFRCGPTEIKTIAPNLENLEIHNSQKLQRICRCDSDEQWQSLKILEVKNCPELMNLPHMPSIEKIRGSQNWWNKVQWKSDEIKSSMDERFKPF